MEGYGTTFRYKHASRVYRALNPELGSVRSVTSVDGSGGDGVSDTRGGCPTGPADNPGRSKRPAKTRSLDSQSFDGIATTT